MSVLAFYADLGIGLPDRGGPKVQVRCLAAPEANRREARLGGDQARARLAAGTRARQGLRATYVWYAEAFGGGISV